MKKSLVNLLTLVFTLRCACHANVHLQGTAATHASLFGRAIANPGSCCCSGVYMHILCMGYLVLMIPAHYSLCAGRERYHYSAEVIVSGEDERFKAGSGCCCDTPAGSVYIMLYDWIHAKRSLFSTREGQYHTLFIHFRFVS